MDKGAVQALKETYKYGTKVELISMADAQAPPPGTIGTVQYVDDIGTIHVNWETGSSLGLVIEKDEFTIIT